MMIKRSYIGERFGKLKVLEEYNFENYGTTPSKTRKVKCICDCGNEKIVFVSNLGRSSNSCGCTYKFKHGMTRIRGKYHPIYISWYNMKRRCKNKNCIDYSNYGGRGITYADRWEKFENFYEDMKEGRRKGLSLDRIDVNGNYSKDNCRWATMKEQQRNKNNNVLYNGKCLSEWAELRNTTIYFARKKFMSNS